VAQPVRRGATVEPWAQLGASSAVATDLVILAGLSGRRPRAGAGR
jgi:hypothetical protein